MFLFYVIITNTMAYWYDGAALAATGSPVIALFLVLNKVYYYYYYYHDIILYLCLPTYILHDEWLKVRKQIVWVLATSAMEHFY